jgi:hypothetical protein
VGMIRGGRVGREIVLGFFWEVSGECMNTMYSTINSAIAITWRAGWRAGFASKTSRDTRVMQHQPIPPAPVSFTTA